MLAATTHGRYANRAEISDPIPKSRLHAKKLREGDMVYADIGTELMGYHSDIQPAYVVGHGTKDQLDLIETL